jgi:hypothetical protein
MTRVIRPFEEDCDDADGHRWEDDGRGPQCSRCYARGHTLPQAMTPAEFAAAMKHAASLATDAAHETADATMCKVLRALGYDEGIDTFEKRDRWYA